MHFSKICISLSLSFVCVTALPAATPDEVDQLGTDSLAKLTAYKQTNAGTSGCTVANAAQRKEWGALSTTERTAFIDAVLCLQTKPSKIPAGLVPGAKTRYDDFVATHINQTLSIHSTGNFLTWHRYYVWAYEKALRDECGYTGYQPYWAWGKYNTNPVASPLFDGSDTSMSGDGGPNAGCVTSGPFKNFTVNLGPMSPTVQNVPSNPQSNGFGFNPRCLRRAISIQNAKGSSTDYTYQLLTASRNAQIAAFQTEMQGYFPDGMIGVHGSGHFTTGGDPGGDFYTSPGDPIFWLHHGMIDRTFWIWQNQALPDRLTELSGTITMGNNPPSRDATLDDLQDLGYVGIGPIKLRDLMSTVDGPFCYVYV